MALAVRQNLKLDMAGMLHKMLDVHRTVAEGRLCLFFCREESLGKFFPRPGRTHALSTAA